MQPTDKTTNTVSVTIRFPGVMHRNLVLRVRSIKDGGGKTSQQGEVLRAVQQYLDHSEQDLPSADTDQKSGVSLETSDPLLASLSAREMRGYAEQLMNILQSDCPIAITAIQNNLSAFARMVQLWDLNLRNLPDAPKAATPDLGALAGAGNIAENDAGTRKLAAEGKRRRPRRSA